MHLQEIIPFMLDPHVGEYIMDMVCIGHVEREELLVSKGIRVVRVLLLEVPVDVEDVLAFGWHSFQCVFYHNPADGAQANRESLLHDSRSGIHPDAEAVARMNAVLSPCIMRGQSVRHVIANNPEAFGSVKERTVYDYIAGGLFDAKRGDLPEACSRRRRKKKAVTRSNAKCRAGRSYKMFLEFCRVNGIAKFSDPEMIEKWRSDPTHNPNRLLPRGNGTTRHHLHEEPVQHRRNRCVYSCTGAFTFARYDPFSTITNALGHVPWFGTISVAPGTYSGPIYIYDKLITIKSEQGPEKTIIRAPETEGLTVDHNGVTNNANLVVYIGSKGEGTLIEGFTLTGGKGAWRAGKLGGGLADRAGGGILCEASATIQNCRIVDNGLPTVEWGKWTRDQLRDGPCLGGGVFVNNGNVNLQDCVISNNFAWLAGGGVCIEGKGATLVMERCTVVRNRIAVDKNDRRVGGVAVLRHGTANLSQCKILDNDDDQVGTLAGRLSVGTTLSLNASRITGGARPGRIIHFHADPESMADAGTNTTITATEPPKP